MLASLTASDDMDFANFAALIEASSQPDVIVVSPEVPALLRAMWGDNGELPYPRLGWSLYLNYLRLMREGGHPVTAKNMPRMLRRYVPPRRHRTPREDVSGTSQLASVFARGRLAE